MSPRRHPRSVVTCRISAHQKTKNVRLLSAMNTTPMTKAPRSASVALRLVATSARANARLFDGRVTNHPLRPRLLLGEKCDHEEDSKTRRTSSTRKHSLRAFVPSWLRLVGLAAVDGQRRRGAPKNPRHGERCHRAPDHEVAGKHAGRDETVRQHERRRFCQQDRKGVNAAIL